VSVETRGEPVKDGLFRHAVVPVLQHDRRDPGGGEDGADDGEGDHAAVLDVQALAVAEQVERLVVEEVAKVSDTHTLIVFSKITTLGV
jgi:hypothetical protein